MDYNFPLEKWKTALVYMSALTPWWSLFIGKFKIRTSAGLGGIVLTKEMDAFIDPDFIHRSSLADIAVRAEYACEYFCRDLARRFAAYSEGEPKATFVQMAKSMEVYDSMSQVRDGLNIVDFTHALNTRFGGSFEKHHGNITLPVIPEDAITSTSYGLPPMQRAEDYYLMLLDANEQMERQELDTHDDKKPEDNPEENNLEPEEKEDDWSLSDFLSDTPEDTSDKDNNESDTRDTPGCAQSREQLDASQDSESAPGSPQTGEHAEDGETPTEGDDNPSMEDLGGENNDSPSSGGSGSGGGQPAGEGTTASRQGTAGSDSSSAPGGIPQELQNYSSIMEKLSDGITDHQRFDSANNDLLRHNYDKDEEQYSEQDVRTALKELAHDVAEATGSPGCGHPSDSTTQWAIESIKKSSTHWTKILGKIISRAMAGAQMSGQSDLSYARRNPNQKRDAPIMMGFVTYPPEITILVDASPSMLRFAETTIAEFTTITKTMMRRYGAPVTWALADTEIRFAETSPNPFGKGFDKLQQTYHGGTDLGEVIELALTKGVKYKRRRYPRPQLVILITDCLFTWPFADRKRLPGKCADIVVASTLSMQDLEKRQKLFGGIPQWLVEGKNFVHVGEGAERLFM